MTLKDLRNGSTILSDIVRRIGGSTTSRGGDGFETKHEKTLQDWLGWFRVNALPSVLVIEITKARAEELVVDVNPRKGKKKDKKTERET